MAVASVIVEVRTGEGEAVLHSLASFENVSVYGIKENSIVTVIEGDDMNAIVGILKTICALENITGAYPVYSGEYE